MKSLALNWSKYTVITDKFDEIHYKRILHKFKDFKELEDEFLRRDTFMLFFQPYPKFRDDDEIHPAYRGNKDFLSKAMKSSEFVKLKDKTIHDEIKSALATIIFLGKVKPPSTMDKIKEALQVANNQLNIFVGWDSSLSSFTQVSAEDRLALASEILHSRKLKEILNLLGKFKSIIGAQKRKTYRTHGIEGVCLGKDISKALPSEIAKLHHPLLKHDFFAKLADGKILQYLPEKSKMGKGEFIACLDLSGSMSGIREIWAKAVALSILMKRKKGTLVFFSESVKDVFSGKVGVKELVQIAEVFYGGGTDFEAPLEKAMELSKGKADILFITDGECKLSSSFVKKFKKFKNKTDTRLITVLIHSKPSKAVVSVSDRIIPVKDLMEDVKIVLNAF